MSCRLLQNALNFPLKKNKIPDEELSRLLIHMPLKDTVDISLENKLVQLGSIHLCVHTEEREGQAQVESSTLELFKSD